MICTEPHPRTPRPRPAARWCSNPRGRALRVPLHHARELPRGAVRLHRGGGAPASTARLLREAVADGHDGWMEDFGEYTPLDAAPPTGRPARRCTTLYPRQYHCGAPRRAGAAAAGALRALGLDRAAPAARRWSGAATPPWTGASTACARWCTNGLTMGLSGVSTWGSDIGGFFALFENQLTPELLMRWIQVGRGVGGDAHAGQRHRHPGSAAAAGLGRRRAAGHWRRWAKLRTQLYPYLAAADAQLPPHRPADHAPPRARLSRRPARGRRARTRSCSAPTCWPRRCSSPGRGARTRLPAARALGGPVALGRATASADGGLALAPAARAAWRARRDAARAAVASCRCWPARARCCRCCRPTWTRWPATATAPPRCRWRERRGRRVLLAFPRGRSRRASRTAACARASGAAAGRSRFAPGARPWTIQASLATLRRPFRPCAVRPGGGAWPAGATTAARASCGPRSPLGWGGSWRDLADLPSLAGSRAAGRASGARGRMPRTSFAPACSLPRRFFSPCPPLPTGQTTTTADPSRPPAPSRRARRAPPPRWPRSTGPRRAAPRRAHGERPRRRRPGRRGRRADRRDRRSGGHRGPGARARSGVRRGAAR